MALLCINVLRGSRLCSISTHLTRNIQVCKEVRHLEKNTHRVSFQFSGKRATNTVDFGAPAPVLHGNAGRVCPLIPNPELLGPLVYQCGHHFHTSAPVRVLPAPVIWIVLKPLQKLVAIILGR